MRRRVHTGADPRYARRLHASAEAARAGGGAEPHRQHSRRTRRSRKPCAGAPGSLGWTGFTCGRCSSACVPTPRVTVALMPLLSQKASPISKTVSWLGSPRLEQLVGIPLSSEPRSTAPARSKRV